MEGEESLPLFRLPPTVYGPSPNGGFVPDTAKGRSFVIKQIGGFVFEKLSAVRLQLSAQRLAFLAERRWLTAASYCQTVASFFKFLSGACPERGCFLALFPLCFRFVFRGCPLFSTTPSLCSVKSLPESVRAFARNRRFCLPSRLSNCGLPTATRRLVTMGSYWVRSRALSFVFSKSVASVLKKSSFFAGCRRSRTIIISRSHRHRCTGDEGANKRATDDASGVVTGCSKQTTYRFVY